CPAPSRVATADGRRGLQSTDRLDTSRQSSTTHRVQISDKHPTNPHRLLRAALTASTQPTPPADILTVQRRRRRVALDGLPTQQTSTGPRAQLRDAERLRQVIGGARCERLAG